MFEMRCMRCLTATTNDRIYGGQEVSVAQWVAKPYVSHVPAGGEPLAATARTPTWLWLDWNARQSGRS
jgi:hypothetical protein